MSSSMNLQVAKTFLTKIASGAPPNDVAALFGTDLDWSIPGDTGVLPLRFSQLPMQHATRSDGSF